MSSGAVGPINRQPRHIIRTRCTASRSTPIQPIGLLLLASSTQVQKRAASCIFAASPDISHYCNMIERS